jgi:hypothetical protein
MYSSSGFVCNLSLLNVTVFPAWKDGAVITVVKISILNK